MSFRASIKKKSTFDFQSHSLSRMQRQTLWHTNLLKSKKKKSTPSKVKTKNKINYESKSTLKGWMLPALYFCILWSETLHLKDILQCHFGCVKKEPEICVVSSWWGSFSPRVKNTACEMWASSFQRTGVTIFPLCWQVANAKVLNNPGIFYLLDLVSLLELPIVLHM